MEVGHRRAQRTAVLKWVRMAQVVRRAMLSSPEWAVKRPLALFPRCKTVAFCASHLVSSFFRLENCCFSQVLVTFYLFIPPHATVEICSFCRKKKSHHTPFSMHTASCAFEVCVAMLRCVTYSTLLQRSSAGDRMSHSGVKGLRVRNCGHQP